MKKVNEIKKGERFIVVNKNTGKHFTCKKVDNETVYIYTAHDSDGNTLGGYKTSIESLLENHWWIA